MPIELSVRERDDLNGYRGFFENQKERVIEESLDGELCFTELFAMLIQEIRFKGKGEFHHTRYHELQRKFIIYYNITDVWEHRETCFSSLEKLFYLDWFNFQNIKTSKIN